MAEYDSMTDEEFVAAMSLLVREEFEKLPFFVQLRYINFLLFKANAKDVELERSLDNGKTWETVIGEERQNGTDLPSRQS